jgi:nucleoside-diphosphate-sugar epimerase
MSVEGIILITGSAGRIGQAVVAELNARKYRLRGFDRVPTPGLADAVIGDIADTKAIRRAAEGVEVVIHLAATPDDADFMTELLPNNIIGLYNIMEAARCGGARRLILSSSGQVSWWQREAQQWPVRVEDPPSPKYWYAATKALAESIGRGYAETHGLSVIVVRLGFCPRGPEHFREVVNSEWAQDVYLSPGDAGRFFACSVEAVDVRFAIVFATSRPTHCVHLDLEPARRIVGFEPQDTWPEGIEEPILAGMHS